MPGLRRFLLSILILLPSLYVYSQEIKELTLKEGSKIWLQGQTNISQYFCTVDSFKLEAGARIHHDQRYEDSLEVHPVHLSVSLYVKSIHCGNKLMNQDVYDALGYPEHQSIVYTYKGAKPTGTIESIHSWNTFEITGNLEIRGIKKTVAFSVDGRHKENHQFHVKGKHNIDMLRYEVEPPSRLNGLIRVHKTLTVYFDIVIGIESDS